MGRRIKDDPYALYAVSEAAADIASARVQLIDGISRMHDKLDAGEAVGVRERAEQRRNQVRCAWRAVAAADQLFQRSGGNAARRDNPLQRFWRDAHVGLQHATHIPGDIYHASAQIEMGLEPAAHLMPLI
jgi:alkylation response protein AidB-like acyl-CoA dehydrogenase